MAFCAEFDRGTRPCSYHHDFERLVIRFKTSNLRADLRGQRPFVRTVQDPFGQLRAEIQVQTRIDRKVQLAVALFREAEEEKLEVLRQADDVEGNTSNG